MKCENLFCIYYENGACSLNDIHLDIVGLCRDCEYLPLSDHTLSNARERYWAESTSSLSEKEK